MSSAPSPARRRANITAKPISGSFTADNKIYDGNTSATGLTRALSGVIGSRRRVGLDTGGTATFDTKNVGTGQDGHPDRRGP